MSCKCEKNGSEKKSCSMYIDYPKDNDCCLNTIERMGPMTQEEIAEVLGVTRARICQLEARALEKVKKRAASMDLE